MGLILGIDSSAAQCAAALVLDGRPIASRAEPMAKGQAERLAPLVQDLLAAAGVSPVNLSGIAVCTGPGNFTGVRIGVAFARGLALSVGRPAVGIPRLEALAAGSTGLMVATAAARSGELHAQAFEDGAPLAPAMQGVPEALAAALAPLQPRQVLGPGAAALALRLQAEAGDPSDLPDPVVIAELGARALAAGRSARPAPVYPRPPDAAPSSATPPRLLP